MDPIPLSSGSNTSWALPLAKQNKWILIDAGPEIDSPDPSYSWDLMQAALLQENIYPENIELVLITHEHIDHAGLAHKWAARGATILAHPFAQNKLIQGEAAFATDRARRLEYLRKNGLPDSIVRDLTETSFVPTLRWQPCPASAIAPINHLDQNRSSQKRKTYNSLGTRAHPRKSSGVYRRGLIAILRRHVVRKNHPYLWSPFCG